MSKNYSFTPPPNWLRIHTIDMHTGGEPLRVITEGFPPVYGENVPAFRRFVKKNHDKLRTALMHEPRGHADMYGCLLLPPNDDGADFGILFLHNEGYSTMCGHATIAIAKLAVELAWVPPQQPETKVVIDAPCGRLYAYVAFDGKKTGRIRFQGVPSFVLTLNSTIKVPGLGKITYDLAYGGAFYAYVHSDPLGLELTALNAGRLIETGMAIKRAIIAEGIPIEHPYEEDLSFLYGVIFIGGPVTAGLDSRNVCIFAEGELDRSPTGSGVSGRMAIHHARGELNLNQEMKIESIIGSVFTAKYIETLDYGPYPAVLPEVGGEAYITGKHEFWIDPEDPFAYGFFLR